jgi:hypothetical protein
MSRYATRPQKSEDWFCEKESLNLPSMTIHAQADLPVNTGLYDKHGDPIYRLPEPIGFLRGRQHD